MHVEKTGGSSVECALQAAADRDDRNGVRHRARAHIAQRELDVALDREPGRFIQQGFDFAAKPCTNRKTYY